MQNEIYLLPWELSDLEDQDQVYLYQEADSHDQVLAAQDHLVEDPSLDHHDLRAEDDLPYQGHKVQVQDQVLVRVLTHIVAAVVVVLVAHNQVPVPVPVLPVLLLLFEVQSLGKDVVQDIHHRYTPSFLFMLVLKCMRSRFL
ncbi:hypothetical protein UCREL1_456 [Eutypa lata UCREL1]|uniref:Uncharacterized protein n=1 Tax=Eutypa lata (strain UCR-EL1) TaxID=1287681 RepID=M7U0P6_EUTLA|nr:hypothetical protein UCREL1_456 [Eutypa lata UCREL1]